MIAQAIYSGLMDRWSKKKRSEVMARIRSSNTLPERKFRSALFARGFRFRIGGKGLPGKPDIVLPSLRTAIFIHGCFWHLHKGCREGRVPDSNRRYWRDKLEGNVVRDIKNKRKLRRQMWCVITVWECAINKDLDRTLNRVLLKLRTRKLQLQDSKR